MTSTTVSPSSTCPAVEFASENGMIRCHLAKGRTCPKQIFVPDNEEPLCESQPMQERQPFDVKELQYINLLIKNDVRDYPKGWCTLPHVEPAQRDTLLKKIEVMRKIPAPAVPEPNCPYGIISCPLVTTIRNQTLEDFDKEIMKKEEWTRLELLAIIAQQKSKIHYERKEVATEGTTTDELWDFSNDLAEVVKKQTMEKFHIPEMIQAEKDNQTHATITDEEAFRTVYNRWRSAFDNHFFKPVETRTPVILKEEDKPGCFGSIGLGPFQELRDCLNGRGCPWVHRCKQSQEES